MPNVSRFLFSLIPIFLGTIPTISHAYDDDRTIEDIDLKPESFLDINAHSFRRSQDLAWLDIENGLRLTGGSISSDRLFFDGELKLRQDLSKHLSVRFNFDQQEYFSNKPVNRPQISVDAFPFENFDLGVSVIGTAAHDKRQADLGYAFTWGREVNDFIRFSWLKVDTFYNEKNEFDDSFYREFGETIRLELVKTFSERFTIELELLKDRPLSFVSESESSQFERKAYDVEGTFFYRAPSDNLYGLRLRFFDVEKSLEESDSNQQQDLDYRQFDVFAVTNFSMTSAEDYELTLGVRFDEFEDRIDDLAEPEMTSDFQLKTTQLYSSVYHQYSLHQATDLGLYLGWSDRRKDAVGPEFEDEESEGVEAKFRGTWQYHSADKKTALRFSLTLNLDDLFNDPGDGGGISFRTNL